MNPVQSDRQTMNRQDYNLAGAMAGIMPEIMAGTMEGGAVKCILMNLHLGTTI